MDDQTQKFLYAQTKEFYKRYASSFSQTRTFAWNGWKKLLPYFKEMQENKAISLPDINEIAYQRTEQFTEMQSLKLLDFGAGNLRFERFLYENGIAFEACCIDTCLDSAQDALENPPFNIFQNSATSSSIRLCQVDVMQLTPKNSDVRLPSYVQPADVAVAFGLFHHILSAQQRQTLLLSILTFLRPGGLAVLSFWQPHTDPKLFASMQKAIQCAKECYPQLAFGENDYVLGWQNNFEIFRAIHSFTTNEVNELIENVSKEIPVQILESFEADRANLYVVLQRRERPGARNA